MREPLNLLVRARDAHEARERLWRSLQLHMDFARFESHLNSRIRIFRGDLTDARFGLDDDDYRELVRHDGFGDSLRGVAQSQIRKKLPEREPARHARSGSAWRMRARDQHGLRRFSHVSTVAVAGQRANEVVAGRHVDRLEPLGLRSVRAHEEILRAHGAAVAAGRAAHDFPPEHRAGRQPPRRRRTSSTWCGRSCFLAGLPALPFRPTDRIDIVPVDFVAGRGRDAASEGESGARDLSFVVGDEFRDVLRN